MSIRYRNGLGKGEDGYYHYCLRVGGALHKGSTWATSLTAAIEVKKKLLDEFALELVGVARARPITLKKLLDEWEEKNTGVLSKTHMKSTLCKLRLHGGTLLNTPITQITKDKVETMRKAYLETPGRHSAGGANSLVKSLKGVLGWAMGEYLKEMPFHLKRIKVQRKPRRVIPLKDTTAFLAALEAPYPFTGVKHCPNARPKNPHAIMACRLMLGLGLREIEALGARWEWIDWTTRTYYAGKTKNGESRIIPVPDYLIELLEKPGHPKEGLILPAKHDPKDPEKKPRPHSAQFTKKVLARAGKDLGIPGLTPHRLRATFATAHARSGTDLDDIRIMLGHSDIATTMIYIESFTDRLAERQNKVAELQGLNKPKLVTPQLLQRSEPAC